jgi:hypothetical protein
LTFEAKAGLESIKTHRSNMHAIKYPSNNSSDDETTDCSIAEFVWPEQAKPVPCFSLKLIHKNWQKKLKFIFNIFKCDRIFDEMLKNGYIKLLHIF